EEDAASGAKTLAVALGVRRSFIISETLPVLAALVILGLHLTGVLPVQPAVLAGTLLVAGLLLSVALFVTGARKPRARRKIYFYLVALVCIVLAGGWFVGVLI